LVQFDYFVCPISYDDVKHQISYECERHPVFILTEVNLPTVAQKIFGVVSKINLLNENKKRNTVKLVLMVTLNTVKLVLMVALNTVKLVLMVTLNTVKLVLMVTLNTVKLVLMVVLNTVKLVLMVALNY
jgi:hypothetical protein